MEDKKKVPSRDKPRELKVTVDGFADYSKKLLNSASRIDSYLDGRGKGRKKEVEFFATFVKELYGYLGLLKNIDTATSNIDKSIKDKIEKHLSSLILSNDKNYGDFISHLKRIDVNVLKTSLDDIKQAILSISFPEQVQGTVEIPQTKTTSKKTRSIEKITVSPLMPKDSRALGISQELFDQMSMSQDDFFNRLENIFINSATVIQREMGDLRTSIVSAINIVPVDTINEEETDTEKESNFYVSIGRIETAANNAVNLLKTLVYDTQEQGKIKPVVTVKPVESIEIKKKDEKFNKDLRDTLVESILSYKVDGDKETQKKWDNFSDTFMDRMSSYRPETKAQGFIGEGIELIGTSLLGPMFSLISSSLIEPFAGKDLGASITIAAGSAFDKIGELVDRVSFIDGEDFISKKPTGETNIPPLEVTETYIPEEPVVQTFDADAKTVFISVRDLIADSITHQTEIKEYAQLTLSEMVLFREDFIKHSELGFVRQDQTDKLLAGVSGASASQGILSGLQGFTSSVAAIGTKLGSAMVAFAPAAIGVAVAGAVGYTVGTLINKYLLSEKTKETIGETTSAIMTGQGVFEGEKKAEILADKSEVLRGEFYSDAKFSPNVKESTRKRIIDSPGFLSEAIRKGFLIQKDGIIYTKQELLNTSQSDITTSKEPLTTIPLSPVTTSPNEVIERVESKDETMIPLLKEAIDKINNIQVNVHTTADTVYASPPVSNNSPSFDAYIKGGE